jgi:hypothetical protein
MGTGVHLESLRDSQRLGIRAHVFKKSAGLLYQRETLWYSRPSKNARQGSLHRQPGAADEPQRGPRPNLDRPQEYQNQLSGVRVHGHSDEF